MSSLDKKIFDLKEEYSSLLDQWEGAIDCYMAKRWPEAFKKTAEQYGGTYDPTFPPEIIEVAEEGEKFVDDPDAFYKDCLLCFQHLANGGRIENDELVNKSTKVWG